jgi:hypothetical protein
VPLTAPCDCGLNTVCKHDSLYFYLSFSCLSLSVQPSDSMRSSFACSNNNHVPVILLTQLTGQLIGGFGHGVWRLTDPATFHDRTELTAAAAFRKATHASAGQDRRGSVSLDPQQSPPPPLAPGVWNQKSFGAMMRAARSLRTLPELEHPVPVRDDSRLVCRCWSRC